MANNKTTYLDTVLDNAKKNGRYYHISPVISILDPISYQTFPLLATYCQENFADILEVISKEEILPSSPSNPKGLFEHIEPGEMFKDMKNYRRSFIRIGHDNSTDSNLSIKGAELYTGLEMAEKKMFFGVPWFDSPVGHKWLSGSVLTHWLTWQTLENGLKANGRLADMPIPLSVYTNESVFFEGKIIPLSNFTLGGHPHYQWNVENHEWHVKRRNQAVKDWVTLMPGKEHELYSGEFLWADPLKDILNTIASNGDALGSALYAMKPSFRIEHFIRFLNPNPSSITLAENNAFLDAYNFLMGRDVRRQYIENLTTHATNDDFSRTIKCAEDFGYVTALMRVSGISMLSYMTESSNMALEGTFPDLDVMQLRYYTEEFGGRDMLKDRKMRRPFNTDNRGRDVVEHLKNYTLVEQSFNNNLVALSEAQIARELEESYTKGLNKAFDLIAR
jgi:hypothetical protein